MNELESKIEIYSKNFDMIINEIKKIIVGQDDFINRLLICLISNGHILVEGLPGLAKTLTIQTLAKTLDISFKRIQFTPDLLPSDLTGSLIFDQKKMEFVPDKGPVFTNLLMADEINRAPAKVQSALLECMQEKRVTIGNFTFVLDEPFLVMATQNPIEQEGTYELPEAQKDRFMFKTIIRYPKFEEEKIIIDRASVNLDFKKVKTLVNASYIKEWQSLSEQIYVDEKIKDYVLNIIFATREPQEYNLNDIKHYIKIGASPRASIFLIKASRSVALMNKRSFVIPEDIIFILNDILRHRIILTYEALAENVTVDHIIESIIKKVRMP